MDIKEMISVLSSHNIYIIFIIMFLESLNLTGIPSTIILPAIGILISLNNLSIIKILLLTIFASILGNIVFYFISLRGAILHLFRTLILFYHILLFFFEKQ